MTVQKNNSFITPIRNTWYTKGTGALVFGALSILPLVSTAMAAETGVIKPVAATQEIKQLTPGQQEALLAIRISDFNKLKHLMDNGILLTTQHSNAAKEMFFKFNEDKVVRDANLEMAEKSHKTAFQTFRKKMAGFVVSDRTNAQKDLDDCNKLSGSLPTSTLPFAITISAMATAIAALSVNNSRLRRMQRRMYDFGK